MAEGCLQSSHHLFAIALGSCECLSVRAFSPQAAHLTASSRESQVYTKTYQTGIRVVLSKNFGLA
jgi:hypothetical protein